MKNTNLKKLILFIVPLVAFLITSPLYTPIQIFLTGLFSSSLIPAVIIGVMNYVAFLVCLLLVITPGKGAAAVLKAIAATILLMVVDGLSSLLTFNLTVAMIWDIIRPAVVVGIFLFAFWWITKRRITLHKPLILLCCGTFAVGVIANILSFLYTNAVIQSLQGAGGSFLTYLQLLTLNNNGYSTAVSACGYLQIFLVSLLALKSLESGTQEEMPSV